MASFPNQYTQIQKRGVGFLLLWFGWLVGLFEKKNLKAATGTET